MAGEKRVDNKLGEYRLGRGWTQQRLADAAGCTSSYVARLEAGISEPSVGLALAIADALEAPVRVLWHAGPIERVDWSGAKAVA